MRLGVFKHGHTPTEGKCTRTYKSWSGMKERCFRRANPKFKFYGGRGITVCDRWLDFRNFLADMGQCPPGLTLDRFPNNNGNYEPGNCRWATVIEQQNNRRSNHLITAFDETLTLSQWVTKTGFNHKTILTRLGLGWTPEKALSLPPIRGRNQYGERR